MSILKPTSVTGGSPKPDTGRRSFIWKTGAAMSAVVASSVAALSKPGIDSDAGLKDQLDKLSSRIGSLEDANAIRVLHQLYESSLDQSRYEDVVGLFAEDAEAIYNGGLFAGKKGIRRLYCDLFRSGLTGKKLTPAPGFEPDPAKQLDIVEVAVDRKTAIGRFPYSMQSGTPMTGDSSLVEMARMQGEGIVKWWEGGTCEVSYMKAGNAWKIRRLEYRVTSMADYRPGRVHAKPIEVSAFSSVFPVNPTGPDKLV